MPSLNLLGRLLARSGLFLLGCCLLLGGFEFIMCPAVATLNIPSLADQLMLSLPPVAQAAILSQFGGALTNQGLLAFAWNHPIVLGLGGAVAALLGARAVAGEVESGAIELLLAQPISRAGFMATQLVLGLGALAALTAAGIAGSVVGRALYHLEPLGLAAGSALALNFWLLHVAAFSVALLLSAFGREVGRVAGAAVLLGLVSYLMQALGQLWTRAAFLLPWSLHHRFAPRELLLSGRMPLASVVVLGAVSLAASALACWRFARRDLP